MPPTKNHPDPSHHHSLQITLHDKFYSRLLSKETSFSNPSFRVYYGGASGAVPFLWESEPGTPKNAAAASSLPPLTPPPSYASNPKKKSNNTKKPSTLSLLHCILPRLNAKPATNSLSTSPSVSSSGSSSSSQRRSRFSSSPRSLLSSRQDDEEWGDEGSPTSTLCCRVRNW